MDLVTTTDPIVSSDVIGTTCGTLADLSLTETVRHDGKQMVRTTGMIMKWVILLRWLELLEN